MGIFNNIKRAFGFGESDIYDDDDITIDATVTPLKRQNETEASPAGGQSDASDTPVTLTIESVPVDSIFSSVISVFNDSLPPFLRESMNSDVQRKYLYEALEADVKDFLKRVNDNAMAACNSKWASERDKGRRDIEELRHKIEDSDSEIAEKDRQLLSAERQKRAINERVHDLESQIAKHEAEKEQLELENRTLVNKMRVMNVLGDSQSDDAVEAMSDAISRFEAEKAELQSTITALNEEIEAMRLKNDMSDSMFTSLNQRASAAVQDAAEKDRQISSLQEQLASANDHMTDLQKQLTDALGQADIYKQELEEAHTNLEIAANIQEEVEKVQKLMEKKNTHISELSTQLRHREDRINALEQEEKSLRKTIENNLRNQAESESSLHERIKDLEQQIKNAGAQATGSRRRKPSQSTPRISAIDEDLDNTDWLVATPPEGTTVRTSGVSDAEFGYQEPPKKTPPENSAQMSLW